MILTRKTERVINRIEKMLSGKYEIEVVGNMILTPNCTVEVWKGQIEVNEKSAEFDEVVGMVAEVEGR